MNLKLTAKFTTAFLVIVIIIGTASIWVGIRLIADGIIKQAQNKMTSDLNAAHEIYNENLGDIKDLIRLTAERILVKEALLVKDRKELNRLLNRVKVNENLDMLSVTDQDGKTVLRLGNINVYGDQTNNEIVKLALKNKEVVTSTIILTQDELLKEGQKALADKALFKILPTPMVKPTTKQEETSGMALITAVPIFYATGEFLGVLYGGRLLNRNYNIVDKVKDVVFRGEVYKGKDIGTATIFQGDLRISTNVRQLDGERAIGTRVSSRVYDQVLVKGESYYDRAFVVNNWYLTAYEPIKDISGNVIGILYVGILEEKYTDMRKRAITTFLAIVLVGMGIAIAVSHFLARTILKPLNGLVLASKQIAKGNLNYRVKNGTADEIGELGAAFNTMASSLKERDDQLKEYTRQQIMRSERLATLGELAAGVAHEINNPLTGVLTYVRLIQKRLDKRSDADSDFRRYLGKVEKETDRCSTIVKNLLDFARQSDPNLKSIDVNLVINESLDLLEHKIRLQNVTVEKKLSSVPSVTADFAQLQQVFMNLIINAVEAMEHGGKLTIITKPDNESKMVVIEFIDTGIGIPKEKLTQIFDPFYTTKQKGTGLGLSVVFGIISRHKGEIDVKSEVGVGTTFTIRLPFELVASSEQRGVRIE